MDRLKLLQQRLSKADPQSERAALLYVEIAQSLINGSNNDKENVPVALRSLMMAKKCDSQPSSSAYHRKFELLLNQCQQLVEANRKASRSDSTKRATSLTMSDAGCPILQAPAEVLTAIFNLLPLKSLVRLARTCQRLRNILFNSPSLWRDLDLTFLASKLSNADLEWFRKRGKQLIRTIVLHQVPKLTKTCLSSFSVSKLPHLESFSLTGNSKIPGIDIAKLIFYSKAKSLSRLEFAALPLMDSKSLAKIIAICPNLKEVSICQCELIGDDALVAKQNEVKKGLNSYDIHVCVLNIYIFRSLFLKWRQSRLWAVRRFRTSSSR